MVKHISSLEKVAMDIIRKSENGVLQSELWKMLGLDSREGSRLVIRLAKKGLIRREQVSVNGRRTYKLYAVEAKPAALSLKVDISHILDLPCTTCAYLEQCRPGNFYEPATCTWLDVWLQDLVSRRRGRS